MIRSVLRCLSLVFVLLGLSAPALAQDRELLGNFSDWAAYRADLDSGVFCYAVSIPEESQLSRRGRNRGQVFFFITSWADQDIANQVSVAIGYPIDEASTPAVRVGNETFEMFGSGERAYLRDESDTSGLLGAMRRGSRMTVTGRSSRGTESIDEYSLIGATAAMESAEEACR